jgi:hypothetical protein
MSPVLQFWVVSRQAGGMDGWMCLSVAAAKCVRWDERRPPPSPPIPDSGARRLLPFLLSAARPPPRSLDQQQLQSPLPVPSPHARALARSLASRSGSTDRSGQGRHLDSNSDSHSTRRQWHSHSPTAHFPRLHHNRCNRSIDGEKRAKGRGGGQDESSYRPTISIHLHTRR